METTTQLEGLIDAPKAMPLEIEVVEVCGAARPPYLNRELSLLDFQDRLLALAESPSLPLLERAKFLAIVSSNLDEFFQVRVAGLKDQLAAGVEITTPDGLSAAEQLEVIHDRLETVVARQSRAFLEGVVPALAEVGVRLSDWSSLDDEEHAYLERVFNDLLPVLTPLAVDPGHPFPYISNLSLNLAVLVRDPLSRERRFARVKVPPLLPRFIVLPDHEGFVPLEQVIAAHLPALFPGMEIEWHCSFRVTRNTDLTNQEQGEEADDLLAAVEMELRRRRFGRAVRLEIDTGMPAEARSVLVSELDLGPEDVYVVDGPLDLTGLWALHELDRRDLKDEPWHPVTPAELSAEDGSDVFTALRDGDVLVHHPYESFATTVEEFIRQASIDPDVLAIKQTLYRTSGDSPIVESLIRAAEQGKQVSVLVELKARFEEQANIAWARALEEAGVHVVYGLVGFKTHSKTALVVRQEPGGMRRYCHVGTGNYNPKTARIYEDIGLLSADPDLGSDLTELFNFLTGYSRRHGYRKLLVAPTQLRARIMELIDHECAGAEPGRIVMKVNSLVDQGVIDALYRASRAGVSIDLIVRGMCCLRPGVPGLSENVRVRSIVGRYLEHSRIFRFGAGGDGVRYLIGSADLMRRNLDRRIEALVPVEAPELQARLQEILDVDLRDDVLAWELGADGHWAKVPTRAGVSAHVTLQELAIDRVRRRRRELETDDAAHLR